MPLLANIKSGKRQLPWALAIPIAAVLTQWTHLTLNCLYPPFENAFDIILIVAASLLKFATILLIVAVALPVAMQRCYQDRFASQRLFLKLTLAFSLLLIALTACRSQVGHFLEESSTTFYTLTPASNYRNDAAEPEIKNFRSRWFSGEIFACEELAILLCSAMISFIGYRTVSPRRATLQVTIVCFAIIWGANIAFNLTTFDYDAFISGTLIGPLALEIAVPFLIADRISNIGIPALALLCIMLASGHDSAPAGSQLIETT